ncbi:hypothetical protein [Shewanella psychrotolerans]|uniref:hypothetical protein n=1 Tax=Shewanella psychrotolerans TaxID=2864206 RepID=UPI001C65C8DC|nr:hypothetical protein [Shewanella psychrotolerans]QYK02540.1 hypothetical protein K0I62_06220 [Shewanella psychrotolerans]
MIFHLTSAPCAGNKVILDGHSGFFLAPQPVISIPSEPLLPANLILRQDDVTMDIGFGHVDRDVPFQARSAIAILYIFLVIFTGVGLQDGDIDRLDLLFILLPLSGVILVSGLIFLWRIIRRRQRPCIRFNRQRRALCYRPSGCKSVRYVAWESLVAYVHSGVLHGASASGIPIKVGDYGLRLAEYNEQDKTLHCFYQGEGFLIVGFALEHWEAIRRFMDEPQASWLMPDQPVPDMQSFRSQRSALWQRFKNNQHKRWLHINLRDYSQSWLTMGCYYLFHLLFWWQVPYLFSSLFLRLAALRPWSEDVLQWSAPLPQAQWIQPSKSYFKARKEQLNRQRGL